MELEITDCLRSATRGMGPAQLKDSFDLEILAKIKLLSDAQEARALPPGWPVAGPTCLVAACWWLTRGIETSAAHAFKMTLHRDWHQVS